MFSSNLFDNFILSDDFYEIPELSSNLSENFGNSLDNNTASMLNSNLFCFNSNFKNNIPNGFYENNQNRNIEESNERHSFHNFSSFTKSFLDLNIFNINNVNNVNNENKGNNEFIGKKIEKIKKKSKFITENPLDKTIFNIGDFDKYSKRIIYDALNLITNKKIKIKKRMYRTDEILNKFLHKLFKKLINQINAKLELSQSKKFFKYLPDCYIKKYKSMLFNAKKQKNLANVDFTLETILSTEFDKNGKKIFVDNINTINYLKDEKNKTIYENSNFYIFKDMKFSEILKQFFNSKEFGMDISILKDKAQEEEYIKIYIFKAKKFLNLFQSNELKN